MNLEKEILVLLGDSDLHMSTLAIAKAVIGPGGTKRDVNPTLYNMKERNLVVLMKTERGRNPMWRLNSSPCLPTIDIEEL